MGAGGHVAFTPGQLGPIMLRNRVVKTATYEGMCPGGVPSEPLLRHHRTLAAGGVGMTTVAYCAVSPRGRTFDEQMHMCPEIVPPLRRLTDAVHAEGAAVSLQIGHCGAFSKSRALRPRGPLGPSFGVNSYGLAAGVPFARAMHEADIAEVIDDFGRAAGLALEAGFDALEIHLGHGYLLSQFLSPATNRRRDRFGGSLENRARLPLAVVERVRDVAGGRAAVLAKINLRDGFRGGLELEDAVGVARRLETAGIDGIVMSGGFTSRTPFYLFRGGRPLAEMVEVEKNPLQRLVLRLFGARIIREYPFEELFFLPLAREVRRAVRVPLVLLGGALSLENLDTAMREGFEFVAMGRALIADPDLVRRMERGQATRSRCISCNKCVAEMDRPGGVRCVLDASDDQPAKCSSV
jgi:2,4-dienoyl-CoA reductase-like NADH-dependent reductase (Old Yellow Enzyme family)